LMLMAELELFFLTSDNDSPRVFSEATQTSLRSSCARP
jgi:hypothetical protein